MSLLYLGVGLILGGLLTFLYVKIANKKLFFSLALILVGLGLVFYVVNENAPKPSLTKMEIERLAVENQRVGDWYALYQKQIDDISYAYSSYHRIMDDFKNDSISKSTALSRLEELRLKNQKLVESLLNLPISPELDVRNRELIGSIQTKTATYINALTKIIDETVLVVKPYENYNEDPAVHRELLENLSRVLAVHSPHMLLIADEVLELRDNTRIPDELLAGDGTELVKDKAE